MSVSICSDAVYTFPVVDPNATFTVINSPDVVVPCTVRIEDNSGNPPDTYCFFNSAFGGSVRKNPNTADSSLFIRPLSKLIECYRILSQSVTAELIAPALSDQGTITSCQRVLRPKTVSWVDNGNSGTTSASMNVYNDVEIFEMPSMDASTFILGTSAYTSKAREGCYQPLKLTDFKWQNFQDPSFFINMEPNDTDPYGGVVTFNIAAMPNCLLPHFERRNAAQSWTDLCPWPKTCGYNFGFTTITGMAANVAVRIRVRQVIEIIAPPSTTYAPLMENALPPDETSVKMYYEISARMADAYPASYNDLGKLKDIILGIGRGVVKYAEPALSALSAVPGPLGAVAGGAKLATSIGKKLLGGSKDPEKKAKKKDKTA